MTKSGCKRILTDATTCSTALKRSCCGATTTPGHAADQGQLDKERDRSALAEAEGDFFFALPIERGGRLGHMFTRGKSYTTSITAPDSEGEDCGWLWRVVGGV